MPRDLIPASTINEHGIIHLARNHSWVNPWNPAIASYIRSNHDISWILTMSKSLSLVYYITNYATKDDVSPLQIVTKAALIKQAINHANNTQAPTTTDLRLRQRGMDNFALRCFNSLSQDHKVSGVQVASTLLQLPSYYTTNYNFTRINLCIQAATSQDVNFHSNHPRHLSHIAITAKDSLPGGHPPTDAILNDMAEIFLGLFVPWERLPDLSACHAAAIDDGLDDQPVFDNEDCPHNPTIDETFNIETLLSAFSSIRSVWDRELHDVQRRITALRLNSFPSLPFNFECL
ncbi:hypothetical protein BJX66DRAFT_329424 [Aspergillus keveii]|uniref:Uncharacterized protein n=1 Tax=Aspergillus keveii TaxID=714993 RepID=A0ABR4FPT8_9EURO